MDKFQKLEMISTYNYSYDTLHVCKHHEKNCGHCGDCIKTLVALDVLGVVNRYKDVFDVEDFMKNRKDFIQYVIDHRETDPFCNQIYKAAKMAAKK